MVMNKEQIFMYASVISLLFIISIVSADVCAANICSINVSVNVTSNETVVVPGGGGGYIILGNVTIYDDISSPGINLYSIEITAYDFVINEVNYITIETYDFEHNLMNVDNIEVVVNNPAAINSATIEKSEKGIYKYSYIVVEEVDDVTFTIIAKQGNKLITEDKEVEKASGLQQQIFSGVTGNIIRGDIGDFLSTYKYVFIIFFIVVILLIAIIKVNKLFK